MRSSVSAGEWSIGRRLEAPTSPQVLRRYILGYNRLIVYSSLAIDACSPDSLYRANCACCSMYTVLGPRCWRSWDRPGRIEAFSRPHLRFGSYRSEKQKLCDLHIKLAATKAVCFTEWRARAASLRLSKTSHSRCHHPSASRLHLPPHIPHVFYRHTQNLACRPSALHNCRKPFSASI